MVDGSLDVDVSELPQTFGELKSSGYQLLPVKAEIRRNVIAKLRSRETLFPGIVGFDDTVIPQLTNAILGSQDIILLGERGQAKSRIVRSLINLLDEWTPVLLGTEIPENPFQPITAQGKQIVEEQGDSAPIKWLHRADRYAEKLATPDITIADLIGEVDPIKVAEGRYLSDELTLHYGLVPRVNRGIFAINELPDLSERIQVGLLNLLEERDIQIRGHKIRLPLDVLVIATANPEDYTNRGRIITPLKDRYGAQIRTHYPDDIDQEVAIMEQEASIADMGDYRVEVLSFMKEVIAEITHQARRSPDINQRSGVSVRTSIADYEALVANAFRRALRLDETEVVPRISDLAFVLPSFQGKVEFEAMEEGQEDKITQRIFQGAMKSVFDRYYDVNDLESIAMAFNDGLTVNVGEGVAAGDYTAIGEQIPGLMDVFPDRNGVSDGVRAATIEFILEGLHLHKLLNKSDNRGATTYSG
ncbi:MAG: sigma 54-interacting transcriptional regulator [Pseudomonadales bacterium]